MILQRLLILINPILRGAIEACGHRRINQTRQARKLRQNCYCTKPAIARNSITHTSFNFESLSFGFFICLIQFLYTFSAHLAPFRPKVFQKSQQVSKPLTKLVERLIFL